MNEQSVVKRTRFGKAAWRASRFMAKPRKPVALRGCVRKRRQEQPGEWGRNAWKGHHVKQGDLPDNQEGVHVRTAREYKREAKAAEEPIG